MITLSLRLLVKLLIWTRSSNRRILQIIEDPSRKSRGLSRTIKVKIQQNHLVQCQGQTKQSSPVNIFTNVTRLSTARQKQSGASTIQTRFCGRHVRKICRLERYAAQFSLCKTGQHTCWSSDQNIFKSSKLNLSFKPLNHPKNQLKEQSRGKFFVNRMFTGFLTRIVQQISCPALRRTWRRFSLYLFLYKKMESLKWSTASSASSLSLTKSHLISISSQNFSVSSQC